MRILFTTTAGLGHFHPLVPLAQTAARAGHEVAFAAPRSLHPGVGALGFAAFATEENTGPDPEREALIERSQHLPPGPARARVGAELFAGIAARRALPELVRISQRWKPDLIVREEYELAGVIAAEHLGLPHAMVQVTYPSDWRHRLEFAQAVAEHLDGLRAGYGLPPDPQLEALYRYLVLSFDPSSFLDPDQSLPPTTHYLRNPVFDRSGDETLPGWFSPRLPRPLIYVTLGTEAPKIPVIFPAAYRAILEGLKDVGGTVVMTVGRDRDPAELGPQPANVYLERYIPQSLLLPHADLVVNHGGHNTVMAALDQGLPLVLIPFFADQRSNAERSQALGVGRMIPGPELTPQKVREAVQTVLGEPSYRASAERMRSEMRAMPGLEGGVGLLEKLVRQRKPLLVGVESGR